MPTTADEEFPSPLQRRHFYELLLGILAFGTALMTFWWFFD
jgi:hypothetical protein